MSSILHTCTQFRDTQTNPRITLMKLQNGTWIIWTPLNCMKSMWSNYFRFIKWLLLLSKCSNDITCSGRYVNRDPSQSIKRPIRKKIFGWVEACIYSQWLIQTSIKRNTQDHTRIELIWSSIWTLIKTNYGPKVIEEVQMKSVCMREVISMDCNCFVISIMFFFWFAYFNDCCHMDYLVEITEIERNKNWISNQNLPTFNINIALGAVV